MRPGLRHFSVAPGSILEVKKVCRSVSLEQCEAVAKRVMTMDSAREIKSYLKEELHQVVPELAP